MLDLLIVALTGVQTFGLTFGIAALAVATLATLLRYRVSRVSVLIVADPTVRRPLLWTGAALTAAGLAAYFALEALLRWWPYA